MGAVFMISAYGRARGSIFEPPDARGLQLPWSYPAAPSSSQQPRGSADTVRPRQTKNDVARPGPKFMVSFGNQHHGCTVGFIRGTKGVLNR